VNANLPTPFLTDFGTWGQCTTAIQHEKSKTPRPRGGGGERKIAADSGGHFCAHCGRPFRPIQNHQKFCKPGCRNYYARLKRQSAIAHLTLLGMSDDVAMDVLDSQGLTRIAAALETQGYKFNGKAWVK
jgi:hypothetical protein